MKRILAIGAVMLMFVSAYSVSQAATKAKSVTVSGEVVSVDAAASSFVLKVGKKDVTIVVNDKTKIEKGKEIKALADVKAGEKATVKYAEEEGKNIAETVKLK